jgi:hypothetical protein
MRPWVRIARVKFSTFRSDLVCFIMLFRTNSTRLPTHCDPLSPTNSPLMFPSSTPADPCTCSCNGSSPIQFAPQGIFSVSKVSFCPPTNTSFCASDPDCGGGAPCDVYSRLCNCADGKDVFDACRSDVPECSSCLNRTACLQGPTPTSADSCLCKRGKTGRQCDVAETFPSCPALLVPNATHPDRTCPTEMCDYCEADGTCVNQIPGTHTICPDDRPCRFIVSSISSFTPLSLFCNGSYACDLVCSGICQVTFVCDSPSCRTVCPLSALVGSNEVSQVFCSNNRTGCHCDNIGCDIQYPCFPGADCFGDPCAGEAGRLVSRNPSRYYVDENGVCQSRTGRFCTPLFSSPIRTPFGFSGCLPLVGTSDCTPPCKNNGYCNQGKCSCLAPWSGNDCSINQTQSLPAKCPPLPAVLDGSPSCPSQCDECLDNKCFLYGVIGDVICPTAFHCVAICVNYNCVGRLICTNNTGPCDIICSGRISANLPLSAGACARAGLICDTPHRCQAHCLYDNTVGNYNPIKDLVCTGASNSSSSCGCGTDTCTVPPPNDPCYDPNDVANGQRKRCPVDIFGTALVPRGAANDTCVCQCPNANTTLLQGACQRRDCSPRCANGGICYNSPQNTPKCQCFSGWTGSSCQSRCFFPVAATVISCEEGRYIIDGKLEFNTTIDLFKNVSDLTQLIVQGNVSVGGGSQLGLGANRTASIDIQGNFIQLNGSTVLISTLQPLNISISLQAFFAGTLAVEVNATQLIPKNGAPTILTLMTFSSYSGKFDNATVKDIGGLDFDNSTCRKLLVSTEYRQTSLVLLLLINEDDCAPKAAGVEAALSAGAIAGIAVAAIVVVVAVGFIIAVILVPGLRSKVLPYKSQRENQPPKPEVELDDAAPESPRWSKATPKQ